MIVNLIILCLVIVSFVCVYKSENCDIKLKYALYSLCAIIFVIQLQKLMNNNMNENFDSNEALQNIASMYNKGELIVENLKVTGNLTTKIASIEEKILIKNPSNLQGTAWQLNNYDGTLMTSSTKSGGRGAVQLIDDVCGEGTIVARYLQPGGMHKMVIGTSRTPNANTYAGLFQFGQPDGRIDPDWREHSC